MKLTEFCGFSKLARLLQCLGHGREWFRSGIEEGKFEMHTVNSIGNRLAALIGAASITSLMLFAYFTPASSAAIGLVA